MTEHKNTTTHPAKAPAKDDAPPGHTKEEEEAVEKTLSDEGREKPVPNAFNPAGAPGKDQQAHPDDAAKAAAEKVQAANEKVMAAKKALEEAQQELWEAAEEQRLRVTNLASVADDKKGAPEKSSAEPHTEHQADHPAAKSHAQPKK